MDFFQFDEEYVRLLANGDRDVGDHFSHYFQDLLRAKARRRLREPELIDDVVQETLMRVLRTLRRDGLQDPRRLGAFVHSVCSNVLMETYRDRKRHEIKDEKIDQPSATYDFDAPMANEQRKLAIAGVLVELHDKDRNLLRALFLEERDRAEVCRDFQIRPGYLRVLVHRAKARFRHLLAEKGLFSAGSEVR